MMRWAIIAATLLAGPAAAQVMQLPAGCEGFLTVQSSDCQVSHFYTCASDPEGHRRYIDVFADGYDLMGILDAEAQWIETTDHYNGTTDRLDVGPVDPALISTLIADGGETWDFTTTGLDGAVTRFVGREKLTGRSIVVGGHTLLESQFSMRAITEDESRNWAAHGTEYVSADLKLYFSGVTEYETADQTWTSDGTPVELILPGETGFLGSTPFYGCAG